jgi:transposase
MVDQDGFPVKSKVYEGNVGEPKTLEEVLESCGLMDLDEELYKPTLAMDRGIATKENIALLKKHGFPYVVIERADRSPDFKQEFIDLEGFETIKDNKGQPIQVKKIGNKVLCLSETRKVKEDAMAQRWVKKAITDLNQLQASVKKGHFKAKKVIEARLSKIRTRYSCFADIFTVTCAFGEENSITYKMNKVLEDPDKLHGCYVIEVDKFEGDAKLIWQTYTTLTKVESAFRAMKTDLGTRPVYHQGAKRTEAHLFLSILAYHMLINIEYRLKTCGDHTSWKSLREELANHRRNTIVWVNKKGETWQKRVSGRAEARHRQIYGILEVDDSLENFTYKYEESSKVVPKNKSSP